MTLFKAILHTVIYYCFTISSLFILIIQTVQAQIIHKKMILVTFFGEFEFSRALWQGKLEMKKIREKSTFRILEWVSPCLTLFVRYLSKQNFEKLFEMEEYSMLSFVKSCKNRLSNETPSTKEGLIANSSPHTLWNIRLHLQKSFKPSP